QNEKQEKKKEKKNETKHNIKKMEEEIEDFEEEIETLEKKIEERTGILKDRFASYQKSGGNIDYLDVIFGSKDFGDLISRISAVTKITSSDQKLLEEDRKSTRLNSSHVSISYAVFCLKKKNILHEELLK